MRFEEMDTAPEVHWSSPNIAFIRVVLPEPTGPTITVKDPDFTVRVTPLIAAVAALAAGKTVAFKTSIALGDRVVGLRRWESSKWPEVEF